MGWHQVVAAIVTAVTAVEETRRRKELAEDQEQLALGQSQEEQRRKTIQQIRKRRIATAQVEARALGTGVQGSSAEIGAVSGIVSQTASNIGDFGVDAAFERRRQRLVKKQAGIQTLGAVRGVSSSIFQSYGGFQSLFSNKEGSS